MSVVRGLPVSDERTTPALGEDFGGAASGGVLSADDTEAIRNYLLALRAAVIDAN